MDLKKKQAEKRLFTKFLSNQSLNHTVSSVCEMDPPDFSFDLFENNEFKEVSVELTRIFNPTLKKNEAAQEKIMMLANDKFKKTRDDGLVVYVDFTLELLPLDNKSLNLLANELFEFVNQIAERNEGLSYTVRSLDHPPFHKYFRTLTVSNEDEYENWQPFGAFMVPYIEENWFLEIVRAKEQKIINYPKKFDKKWIVLLSNFGHQSSSYQFSIANTFENSPFDKIYIYQYFNDVIIKLK